MRLLLERGAELGAKDAQGRTASGLGEKMLHLPIAQVLEAQSKER